MQDSNYTKFTTNAYALKKAKDPSDSTNYSNICKLKPDLNVETDSIRT